MALGYTYQIKNFAVPKTVMECADRARVCVSNDGQHFFWYTLEEAKVMRDAFNEAIEHLASRKNPL